MKKTIIFLVILVANTQAFAQVSLGLTGGFLLPVKDYKDSLPSPFSAYKLGIEGMYSINPHWKLRAGIEYVSYKFFQNYQSHNISKPDSNQFFFAQYISIPVGVRYVFNGKKFKPFIDGSMSFMGNIAHHSQYQNADLTTTFNPTPKSFIVAPSLGAGLLFNPTDKIYLSFMMSYSMQLGYVYEMLSDKNIMKQLRYNSLNWQLSIGYNF